jgi:hypothetical protein
LISGINKSDKQKFEEWLYKPNPRNCKSVVESGLIAFWLSFSFVWCLSFGFVDFEGEIACVCMKLFYASTIYFSSYCAIDAMV